MEVCSCVERSGDATLDADVSNVRPTPTSAFCPFDNPHVLLNLIFALLTDHIHEESIPHLHNVKRVSHILAKSDQFHMIKRIVGEKLARS